MEIRKPNTWKKVLLEIYRHAPGKYCSSGKMSYWDDQHDLAKRLRIKGHELGESISFLEDNKLTRLNIQSYKEYSDWVDLTEKGFNIALELEKQSREVREKKRVDLLQLWLVILTAILAISAIVNILF
ncbi:Uncharacterised protein [uncultured archaeon]|nr:Uncharacterised protein [uncultured archaeon]